MDISVLKFRVAYTQAIHKISKKTKRNTRDPYTLFIIHIHIYARELWRKKEEYIWDGNLNGGRIIFLKHRNNFSHFPCRWQSVGGYGVIEKMEN